MAAECAANGCDGPPVEDLPHCLGHVNDEQLHYLVPKMRREVKLIDVRRAHLDASRVTQILSEAVSSTGRLRVPVNFGGARIAGDVVLNNLNLGARLDFAGANVDTIRIGQIEGLSHLRLGAPAWERTKIGTLIVSDCVAPGEEFTIAEADIDERLAVRRSSLRFLGIDRARLGNRCVISDLSVATVLHVQSCSGSEVSADNLRVADGVTLDGLYIETLNLTSCTLDSWVDVVSTAAITAKRCTFGGPTRIQWATPTSVSQMMGAEGPRRGVSTSGFQPPAEREASTSLTSVRFASTAHLRLAGADVELVGCVFSDASTLEGAETASSSPRLVNVSEMDGDELRIGAVDVSSCQLAAAASLGPIDPHGLEIGFGAAGLTRRRYVADEGARPTLRARWQTSRHERESRRARAQQLAATYRDLRRGNEEIGNHAGSNDLYYGERLWERKASSVGGVDWLWLAAYGLVGYGVRPLRPLLWLVALVLGAALAFGAVNGLYYERTVVGSPAEKVTALCDRGGQTGATLNHVQKVACPADLAKRLEFTVRTTTTIIRPIGGFETYRSGIPLDIVVRLAAALLFALLVLAVRNRVRR